MNAISRYSDLLRVCLVPVFVVLCYQLDWEPLRSATCSCFVTIANWMGIPAVRISSMHFSFQNRLYFFATSCTALDAFFGSIPLVFCLQRPARLLMFWVSYLLVLSIVNIVRLVLGFILFIDGMPWWLAHEAMAGIFYFGLLLWIFRQRGWSLDTVGLSTLGRVPQTAR